MAGFFERRAMKELHVHATIRWTESFVHKIASDYSPDGLMLRASVGNGLALDLASVGGYWFAIPLQHSPEYVTPVDERRPYSLGLTLSADPRVVSARYAAELAVLKEHGEGEQDADGGEDDEADFDQVVTVAVKALVDRELPIEVFTKADELRALVQVEGMPDLFWAVVEGEWEWTIDAQADPTRTGHDYDGFPATFGAALSFAIVTIWHLYALTDEGAEHIEREHVEDRIISPCLDLLLVILGEDLDSFRDTVLSTLLIRGSTVVTDHVYAWLGVQMIHRGR